MKKFKKYEIATELLPFSDLVMASDNPRNYCLVEEREGESLSQQESFDLLTTDSKMLSLKKSIEASGLARPLVVQRKQQEGGTWKWEVHDGNRRYTALYHINIETGDFNEVPCEILPNDMPVSIMMMYVSTIHGHSPEPWDSLSQAIHTVKMHKEQGIPVSEVCAICGIKKDQYQLMEGAADLTKEYRKRHGDKDKRWSHRYSQFYELLKVARKKVGERMKSVKVRNLVFDIVQRGIFGNSQSVRKIKKYIDNLDALEILATEPVDEAVDKADACLNNLKNPAISIYNKLKDCAKSIKHKKKLLIDDLNDGEKQEQESYLEMISLMTDVAKNTPYKNKILEALMD